MKKLEKGMRVTYVNLSEIENKAKVTAVHPDGTVDLLCFSPTNNPDGKSGFHEYTATVVHICWNKKRKKQFKTNYCFL